MALKDTWIDRKDGDEIRPEDINDVANAAINNEKAIEDKASKDHTHNVANYTTIRDASFEGRTTINFGADQGATFTADTLVAGSRRSTFKVACEGDVIIDFSSNNVASFDVDGIGALSEIVPVEGIEGVSRWQGEVINNIVFGIKANSSLALYGFTTDKYTNGFMTGRQAKKLDSTEIFTTEEKAKLESIDKVYTQEESDLLLDAHSIVTKKAVALTGDELEGKKDSDHIYLKNITNDNAVVFGEEYETTGRYFGYVGVKGFGRGYDECVLVAELDIESDFDMSKVRVQGFTKAEGGSETPTLEVIGTPRNEKNYIIYPCNLANKTNTSGFYFDAQMGNNPTVKMTLRDVRVYKQTGVLELPIDNTEIIKEWKHEPFQMGNGVVSSLEPSILIYREIGTYRRWRMASLTDAMTVDALLYKPNDDVYANKRDVKALSDKVGEVEDAVSSKAEQEDLTILEKVVTAKGLSFMQYNAGEKIPLEKDCLYYLRCNTDTIYYYKNGTKLSQFTSSFGDGFVMMSSNIFQGAHVNFFAAVAGFMDYSMKGNTITTLDTDEVYAMSSSDFVNVWKVKA